MNIDTNIIQMFLTKGTYKRTTKTILIEGKETQVIDCETFQIEDNYLKRTYLYNEKGNQSVIDETNYSGLQLSK